MSFSGEERECLHLMILVTQSISIVSCIAVIAIYFCLKELRQFTFKLVAYLALADIFKGLGMLLSPNNEVMCLLQAMLNVYFELSSFLWVAVISYVLYSVIINKDLTIDRKEVTFVIVCNLPPLVACILPIFFDNYGYAQGWCFIDDSGDGYLAGSLLRALAFYLPLYAVLIYSFYTYSRINREISQFSSNDTYTNSRRAVVYRLYLYPVVLIISYIPVTVYRIFNFTSGGDVNFPLALVSSFFMGLNGLMNAVVYGLTKSVREAVLSRCRHRVYDSEAVNYTSMSDLESEPDTGTVFIDKSG